MVAALDALRELDLLRRGQQVDLADVLQEELERVGRDLARFCQREFLFRLLGDPDDVDLHFLERPVEIVDLACIEVELVECECDLVLRDRACRLRRLEQGACFLRLEYVSDRGAVAPRSPTALTRSPSCFERCRTMPAVPDMPL